MKKFIFSFLLASSFLKADFLEMLDYEAMDKTVEPCNNFYQFSCGNWIQNNKLPKDKSIYVRSFSSLFEENQKVLKNILENLEGSSSLEEKMLASFYESCMDLDAIEKAGKERISSFKDQNLIRKENFEDHILTLLAYNSTPFLTIGIGPDYKNVSMNILHLDQANLTLPSKSYYTSEDKKHIREEFLNHVKKIFVLFNYDEEEASLKAKNVLSFESQLAEISRSLQEKRDREKNYFLVTYEELKSFSPFLKWQILFKDFNLQPESLINIAGKNFIEKLSPLLEATPFGVLKDYILWHSIHVHAGHFTREIRDENFLFFSKFLYGTEEKPERWKTCVQYTDHFLRDILGKIFVEKTFKEESKEESKAILKNISEAFAKNLETLDWIDETTRQKSLKKLKHLKAKIAYPDRWEDMSKLKIKDTDSFFLKILSAKDFWIKKNLEKAYKKVNPYEWSITVPTANAYYRPYRNEMIFPAGILQAPLFDIDAPKAANYGAYGMVIGHELTHGFDDQGRKNDFEGNLDNWWSEECASEFEKKAECLVDQFSSYSPIKDSYIDGQLTLGENIADLGGLKLAYMAYKIAEEKSPEDFSTYKLDRFSNSQKFFISYAQVWCTRQRDEWLKKRLLTAPHPPEEFRVNGVLKNFADFQEAFSCKAEDAMVAKTPCSVW